MGVALKIDRPLFLLIEGFLNGFLLLVLPVLPVPTYVIAFIGLCVNLLVAYLIAESPSASTGTGGAPLQVIAAVWNRLRYWARPLFR
jgi:hypothetical protein